MRVAVVPRLATHGNVRLVLKYKDGSEQLVHYYIVGSAPAHVAGYTAWLASQQLYTDTSDPFSRAPSFLNYDRRTGSVILQDTLAWISGLSDECGAGNCGIQVTDHRAVIRAVGGVGLLFSQLTDRSSRCNCVVASGGAQRRMVGRTR